MEFFHFPPDNINNLLHFTLTSFLLCTRFLCRWSSNSTSGFKILTVFPLALFIIINTPLPLRASRLIWNRQCEKDRDDIAYIKYKLHDRQQREKLHISLLEVSTWGERRRRAAALQEVDWKGRKFLMWICDEKSDGLKLNKKRVAAMMEFKSQIFMLWISWRFIDHIKFSHIAPNESFNDAPSSLNTVTKYK